MDREIKFRIWNKLDKTMILPNPLDAERWLIDSCGNLCAMNIEGMRWHGIVPKEAYEIMWYTGLKDINGKEIYEGDIVSAFDGKIKAKIIWGFCGFEFEWITKRTAYIRRRKAEPLFSNTSIIYEVIGDVYTTPELSKEE